MRLTMKGRMGRGERERRGEREEKESGGGEKGEKERGVVGRKACETV